MALTKEKRAEIEAKLKELEKVRDANLIYHFKKGDYWYPNPFQEKILAAWKNPRYKVFVGSGANRKGKTTIAIIISYAVMFGEWPWSGEKIDFPHNDPRQVLYVGQAWESHIQKVVEPELERLWPKHRGDIGSITKKNNQGVKARWRDPSTGSELHIYSNNQDSDTFEGDQYDLIVWDEPPKRANRIAAIRGLVDRNGRELFVATLLKEAWMHREVVKARLADGTPDTSIFHVDGEIFENVSECACGEYISRLERDGTDFIGICSKCGPVKDFIKRGLTLDGVDQFTKGLRKDEIEARIKGKPSYLGNLVLPNFSRDIHVKDRFKIPLNWIVDISIDFHPSKPWAVLFEATGPNDFHYMCDFIHEKGNPKYIAEEIIRKAKNNEYFINSITIDPLAKGGENAQIDEMTVFKIMEKVFRSYNHRLDVASKDKDNGITLLNDSLMTENEMPARFIFRDLVPVIEQLEDWMYDPETLKPSKENDDFCEVAYRIALRDTKWKDPYDREKRLARLPKADMGELMTA
uniref:Terminase n=1 Tax=viral metagenome TaxID=1070528 RepID=A0A6M3IV11_9ZZZZ